MKICIAQTRPVRADIEANIANHSRLINLAISHGAGLIIFPELSLTGYEPALAKELASSRNDSRFEQFQSTSNLKQVTIGVGAPVQTTEGIHIGMILFQPGKERKLYVKKHLHADEEQFFTSGQSDIGLIGDDRNIALAICYEISVLAHAEAAQASGAKVYIASVAKTAGGVDKAYARLAEIAGKYSMTVLMSNCVGPSGDGDCTGSSAVWNNKGELLQQLDEKNEGLIILDIENGEIISKTIHS